MPSNMTKTFLGYDLESNMKGCKIGLVLQKIHGIDIWSGKCGARYPIITISVGLGIEMGLNKDIEKT